MAEKVRNSPLPGKLPRWVHAGVAAVTAATVVGLSLPGTAERLAERTPAQVETDGLNALLQEELAEAEAQARRTPSVESMTQLGRLYHANGYFRRAKLCWLALAKEDPDEGRWPHYLAQLARVQSDQDDVWQNLRETVARSPHYSPAWLQLADLAFKREQFQEAAAAYERRLSLEPGDPYAQLGLARLDLQDLDRESAKERLQAVIMTHPEFSAAHNLLAQLAIEEGREEDARRLRWRGHAAGRFEEAPDPWVRELDAWCFEPGQLRILGMREYQNERPDGARELIQKSVAVAPDDPGGHELLGDLYLKLDELPLAQQTLREAHNRFAAAGQITPISVFLNWSESLRRLDRPAEAVALLAEGIALHPNSYELHNSRGVALSAGGDAEAAIAAFRRALLHNPYDADTNFNLATLLFNRGAETEALEHYRAALKLKPTYPQSLSFLAQYEMAQGRLETARPYVDRLFDAYPEIDDVKRIAAQWQITSAMRARQAGETAQMIEYLHRAFDIAPQVPPSAQVLGDHYMAAGRFDLARRPLEVFHQQTPEDPSAAMSLAQVYAQEGRFREARSLLERAASLAADAGNQELEAFCREILQQLPR